MLSPFERMQELASAGVPFAVATVIRTQGSTPQVVGAKLILTDELAARRFNRAAPDASLMLLKPAGAVPHAGGVLMQPGDPYYEPPPDPTAGNR